MNEEILKRIKLGDEVENSIKQIIAGLKELQTSVRETAYYFIVLQLLANGFERLLKSSICYGFLHKKNCFPTAGEIKTHDISKLLSVFISEYFSDMVPALKEDLKFLKTNKELETIINSLTEFGKYARYHNLNVVTGDINAVDVKDIWQKIETDFVMNNPEIKKILFDKLDYDRLDQLITNHFVIIFEKLTRGIVRQFTLGDLGEEPKKYIGFYSHFLFLKDDEFGITDYNEKFFQKKINDPGEYIENNKNKRTVITKSEDNKRWPYKHTDSIIIEKSTDGCVFVIVNKKVYALTGTTAQKYKLPFTHDIGETYKGRSEVDIIKMALEL